MGFGIAQKLISEYLDAYARPPTLVLACRNAARAQAARTELLNQFFPLVDSSLPRHLDSIRSRKVGQEVLQIQLVDLSSTASVFKACEEIKKKYDFFMFKFTLLGLIALTRSILMLDLFPSRA